MPATYLGKIVETITPTHVVIRELNGKKYKIYYIDDSKFKEASLHLLGYAYKGKIYLRNDLPKIVERSLLRHEVYHIEDQHIWLGKYGQEIRANIHTIFHDPLGFLATLVYSLNKGRLKTYWRLYISHKNYY